MKSLRKIKSSDPTLKVEKEQLDELEGLNDLLLLNTIFTAIGATAGLVGTATALFLILK